MSCMKRIRGEIKSYNAKYARFGESGFHLNEEVALAYNPENLREWYFIIRRLEAPYTGGEYIAKISVPDRYPHKNPDFRMLTPSGRFTPNTNICTTFSSYHNSDNNPLWTIATMALGFVSFMMDDKDSGLGSIRTSDDDRRRFAVKSTEFNRKCEVYQKYFKEINT